MNIRFGVLTVSDRSAQGERPDVSGPVLVEAIQSQGWKVVKQAVLPDDKQALQETLAGWADSGEIDILLTTGGTGFAPRDITPEATQLVIERAAPGLAEVMRAASLLQTPHAMLSRATAGIRRNTLIVNLPGNPRAALENLEVILPALPHAAQLLTGSPQAEAGHSASHPDNET